MASLRIWEKITLVVFLFCASIFLYWTFWPVNMFEVTHPITTDKSEYQPEDRITYTLPYCKTKDIPGTVMRSLNNGVRILFTQVESALPIGCHTVKNNDLIIPDYAEVGTYYLQGTAVYKINPLRDFIYTWRSEPFKVISPELIEK